MKNKKLLLILALGAVAAGVMTGCSNSEPEPEVPVVASEEMVEAETTSEAEIASGLVDGTYRAEYGNGNEEGWKPFLEMNIVEGKITEVIFDEINEASELNTADDTFCDELEAALIETQDPTLIDTLLETTETTETIDTAKLTDTFKNLATQLLGQATEGNAEILVIDEQKL